MKHKSGLTRITKAALFLALFMIVQTGFGQSLGLNSHSRKKSLKRTYKCAHIGVQKVKHIQGRSKQVRPVAVVASNEVLLASIVEPTVETMENLEMINPESATTPVVNTPTEEKKDTMSAPKMRLLPQPVYFRYDSYRLDIIDLTQIALAVSYVKEGYAITVVGHTDDWGSEQYNDVLSDKRANIIRDMMIELGCKPELIKARGEGEKYPISTNEHAEGRQSNRRVEFLIALN
ncbi:MAG TPA: OmpA family protein [Cytophagaceae bacterium]|jgi:outer membrane protein OmpA-like peptidoglycan-associated protein|nr:OmpA family protein [Cytophagaceae bacterium]